MERILLNFLVLLQLLTVNLALEQTAYAIYDINADHFTLSINKPEDDYAAYAFYSNTINQTGQVYNLIFYTSIFISYHNSFHSNLY